MAFGGLMTALCVTVMTLGSLIPVNTYVCPVVCMLLLRPVLRRCGKRLGWCCYLATAILGLLLAPDREAAMVYAMLGYYPIIKPRFDRLPLAMVWKLLFFTAMGAVGYWLLTALLGLPAEAPWLLGVTLVLWDALFLLTDRLLTLLPRKKNDFTSP